MGELIYKELSYLINGLAYQIDNELGYGLEEKAYANALEELLKEKEISYQREVYFPVKLGEKLIAKKYFDFLIDNKIVLELKVGEHKYKEVCGQLFRYLKASKLKLGLILRFTKNGVKIKRIPNLKD